MLKKFNEQQQQFLRSISKEESEKDWLTIPGFLVVSESVRAGKITGLAGITLRYFIIPSLFIAVSKEWREKGIASALLSDVLKKWRYPVFLTYYAKKPFLKEFYSKFGFKKLMGWGENKFLCLKL